ncbi:MAG: gfo/Idh/MocA family oxidoreductase, partial [Verrucomicrobiota bacterium]
MTAAALAPLASAFAAGRSGRIRVGQVGTSHAHASGKMESVRSLSDLYEVVGVAEPVPGRQTAAKGAKAYAGLPWMDEGELLADQSVEAVLVETTLADS